MKKIVQLAVVASVVSVSSAILSGCSGHPGAGHWVAEENPQNNASKYSALELEFDGKGVLHPNKEFAGQENKDDLKCLWQAKTANAVEVQCGNDTTDQEKVIFSLQVSNSQEVSQEGKPNQANLLLGQQIVSSFIRTR